MCTAWENVDWATIDPDVSAEDFEAIVNNAKNIMWIFLEGGTLRKTGETGRNIQLCGTFVLVNKTFVLVTKTFVLLPKHYNSTHF